MNSRKIKGDDGVGFQPPHTLYINGNQIALGLFWQPQQTGISIREQAKQFESAYGGFDSYCFAEYSNQIGFGHSRDGHKKGMISGAGLAALQLGPDNCIGVFCLEKKLDYWWVFAKRSGSIYHDAVIRGYESVIEEVNSFINAPDWEQIIAPKAFLLEGSIEKTIHELFQNAEGPKLKPTGLPIKHGLLVCFGLVFIGFVVWGANSFVKQRELLVEEDVTPVINSQIFIEPWRNEITLTPYIYNCVEQFNQLFFAPFGWRMETMSCQTIQSQLEVNAKFNRGSSGTIDHIRKQAIMNTGKPIEIDCLGDCVWLRSTNFIPKPHREDEIPWESKKVENIVRESFQNHRQEIQIQRKGPRVLGGQLASDQPPVPSYHEFSLLTSVNTKVYLGLLEDIPGLVPESLTYAPTKNTWLLTGKIFHQNPQTKLANVSTG